MSVWDDLVGQEAAVAALSRAADGHGMTHSWLVTGPPGSGRSNVAVAFAAALKCAAVPRGCGQCPACRQVRAGSNPDVTVLQTQRLSIGVDDVRDLVRRSALAPVHGPHQVMVIEDADRLTDQAANALLKAVEEPTDRTVWVLCAPTTADVLPTIRSRCRSVALRTPQPTQVREFLTRVDGAPPALAAMAARVSQGHIGRARAFARDEQVRARRREVVTLPAQLTSLGHCLAAATAVVAAAKDEADEVTAVLDAREKADLAAMYGVVERGRRPREYAPALAAMEREQKTRAKRRHLDMIDRRLSELVSVYRDAVTLALGATGELVNEEMREEIAALARVGPAADLVGRIEAVFTAREQMLEFNVPPQLALESMMVALQIPGGIRTPARG